MYPYILSGIGRGEYRDGARRYRNGIRRAKTQLELNVARDLGGKGILIRIYLLYIIFWEKRGILIRKGELKQLYTPTPNTSVIMHIERTARVSLTFEILFGSVFAAVILPTFPMFLNFKVRK